MPGFNLGLESNIAADVQASVYVDLGDLGNLPWIGLGFSMASVAVILFARECFNQFDTKWLTNISILIFQIGSAVCGAAQSSNIPVVGQIIAGIDGAGMYLG